MAILEEIKQKDLWENFVVSNGGSVYQSWNWGLISENNNTRIKRVAIFEESLALTCQIEIINAKRGKFINIHHGPILKTWDVNLFLKFIDEITKLAKEEKAWFIRLSTNREISMHDTDLLKQNGFKQKVGENKNGVKILLIDLTKDEESILAGFRKSTRYNIKKAQRDGIDIKIFEDPTDNVSALVDICKQTAINKNFHINYDLAKLYQTLSNDKQAVFIGAYFEGKPIAAGLYINYANEIHSFYRGSENNHLVKYAPYLVQWEAIKLAKNKGVKTFNLWGITDSEDPKHPWYGFSQFKKGFSDHEKILAPVMDKGINTKYILTRIYESLESKKSLQI